MKKPDRAGVYWFKGTRRWCPGAARNKFEGPIRFTDGGGPHPVEILAVEGACWPLKSFEGEFLLLNYEIAKRGQRESG